MIKYSPDWVFDLTPFDLAPTEPPPGGHGSMAGVMQVVTRKIVSGPVDFDQADFYGWTALTFEQMAKFALDLQSASPNDK